LRGNILAVEVSALEVAHPHAVGTLVDHQHALDSLHQLLQDELQVGHLRHQSEGIGSL